MGRKLTEGGAYLREAIASVLAKAKEPLDSVEVASDPLIADVGLLPTDVSNALLRMFKKPVPPFPLRRIRAPGHTNTRWKYYNPTVVQVLEDKPRGKHPAPKPEAPAAPPVPEFQFNPVALEQEVQKPTVEVPAGVKSITVKVGGVSIHIELDAPAVAR